MVEKKSKDNQENKEIENKQEREEKRENKEEAILKNKVEECEKLKQQYLAGWQRERAAFLNYKKEEKNRLQEALKISNEKLARKLLLVLDSFDLAEEKIPSNIKNDGNIKGFLQIKTQLLNFLKELGAEELDVLNKEFDPKFSEAVGEVEIKDKKPGIIVEIVQKGYKFSDKVLRPAKVKISKQGQTININK